MILINLLPEELRIKEKAKHDIPILKVAAAVGVVLGLLTVFFYFDFLSSQSKLKKLEQEWVTLQPQSMRLNQLEQEVETVLKPENLFLNRFVTADKPLTSILSWVSELLPDTAWLLEIRLDREGEGARLFVKGVALPSKEKSSIEQIETYLHQMKEKIPEAGLSLTTTRLEIENTEVTQFIANFEWGIAAVKKP